MLFVFAIMLQKMHPCKLLKNYRCFIPNRWITFFTIQSIYGYKSNKKEGHRFFSTHMFAHRGLDRSSHFFHRHNKMSGKWCSRFAGSFANKCHQHHHHHSKANMFWWQIPKMPTAIAPPKDM